MIKYEFKTNKIVTWIHLSGELFFVICVNGINKQAYSTELFIQKSKYTVFINKQVEMVYVADKDFFHLQLSTADSAGVGRVLRVLYKAICC